MKMPALSNFRQMLVLTKVEKYLVVGNKLFSEASGKAIKEAKTKASLLMEKVEQIENKCLNLSTSDLQKTLQQGLDHGKKWLVETPQRALEEAYNAALILKKIEEEHLAGDQITSISNSSDSVATYFQMRTKKYLLLIEIRMMEFRVSNSMIDTSSFNQHALDVNDKVCTTIDKLRFIDEVLARYHNKQNEPQQDNLLGSVGDVGVAAAQKVCNQLGNKWQLLESFRLPFSQDVSQDYTTVDVDIELEKEFSSPFNPGFVKSIGLASLIFTGGALGGAYSWSLVSNPDAVAHKNLQPTSTEIRSSERHQPQVISERTNTQMMPSTPEMISPDFLFAN